MMAMFDYRSDQLNKMTAPSPSYMMCGEFTQQLPSAHQMPLASYSTPQLAQSNVHQSMGMRSAGPVSPVTTVAYHHDSSIDSDSTSTCSPVVSKDISDISDDQLACLCKSLRYTESIPKLERLLTQLPEDRVRTNEDVMISKAVILYHQKRFTELFELLQSFKFASENHEMLQEIWKNAHYEQTESKRPKPLDAVTKYRLRKKHVYPMTIWDGETTSYCFKNSSRKILQAAYKKNQMPSPEEKKALAIKAKLELGQVSNWFKNRRQRDRQQQKLGSNSPHSNDDDDTDSFASRSSPSLSPPSSAASGSASASTNAAANPAGVAPISNATPPIMPCGAAGYWPMGPSTVGGGYGSSCATGVNGQNNYFYNFEHLNQLAAAAYGGAGGYGFGGMSADMTSL